MKGMIRLCDVDGQVAELKKARAILMIMQEESSSYDEELGWLNGAAFDYVHNAMEALECLVEKACAEVQESKKTFSGK